MTGLRPETLLAQAAGTDDPATGGIIPPLQPSTTFVRDPDNAYRRGFDYTRDCNPTYAPAALSPSGYLSHPDATRSSSVHRNPPAPQRARLTGYPL